MKTTVQLDTKDIRRIIATQLQIPEEDVIPNRYNFSIVNLSPEEIERRICRRGEGHE